MNKNGWGLRVELAFILMFLVCLIIAVIGITTFSDNTNINITNSDNNDLYVYNELETKLQNAAADYYNKSKTPNEIITLTDLVNNGYISFFKDKNGKECDGYVKLVKNTDNVIYSAYIKCPDYKTFGYNSSLD